MTAVANSERSWLRTLRLSATRSGRQARRTPALAFILPVVPALAMVGVYAQLLSRMSDLPGFGAPSYVDFMTAGAVTVVPMTGAAFSGMALAEDLRGGYIDRIRMLPAAPGAFLAGRALLDGLRMLPAAGVVIGVGAAFGANVKPGVAGWVALAAMIVLWTIAYNALFLLIAVRTKSPEAVQAAFPIFAPLTFLSSVWFPRNLMPQWAKMLSGANPVTPVTDGIRDVLTDGVSTGPVLTAVAAAVGVGLSLQLLVARSLLASFRGD